MTPAWRRLMGLIRLGKWLGLAACLAIAAAIPLSTQLHGRFTWSNGSIRLAHGALTIEGDAFHESEISTASEQCCPRDWLQRWGLIAPEGHPIVDRTRYIYARTNAKSGTIAGGYPWQWNYPLWEFLLLIGWPTLFLWLADRPQGERRTLRRLRRMCFWLGCAATACSIAIACVTVWRRVDVNPTGDWRPVNDAPLSLDHGLIRIRSERNPAIGFLAPSGPSAMRPPFMEIWSGGPTHRTSGLDFRFPVIEQSGNSTFVLPLWFVSLLILPPTFLLFVQLRCGPPNCCAACGYNLTGNVSGVCPECGSRVAQQAGPLARAPVKRGLLLRTLHMAQIAVICTLVALLLVWTASTQANVTGRLAGRMVFAGRGRIVWDDDTARRALVASLPASMTDLKDYHTFQWDDEAQFDTWLGPRELSRAESVKDLLGLMRPGRAFVNNLLGDPGLVFIHLAIPGFVLPLWLLTAIAGGAAMLLWLMTRFLSAFGNRHPAARLAER